jgi:hypothetical protein
MCGGGYENNELYPSYALFKHVSWGGRETMNFIVHTRYLNTCGVGGRETMNFILDTRYVNTCVCAGCGGVEKQ